jgi:hypothetical protein
VTELKQGGRDVARIGFVLLTVAVASTLFSVQAIAPALRKPNLDLTPALGGGPLTQTQKVSISRPFAQPAKLKARLIVRLRESIFDDAK